MEQSIKSVLVKQTIAHQQQQLTNLQVSKGKKSTLAKPVFHSTVFLEHIYLLHMSGPEWFLSG